MDINFLKNKSQNNKLIGRDFFFYPTISSTNDAAKELALKNVPEGTIVLADFQTKGRGQRGRQWLANPEETLLFSIILYPKNFDANTLKWLTRLGAIGVQAVAKDTFPQKDVIIKEPNDVLVCGKKIAGVLVELATQGSKLQYAILGIGINVNVKNFPEEIKDTATSFYLLANKIFSREQILVDVLKKIDEEL